MSSSKHDLRGCLRNAGYASFLFSLIKGILWLVLPVIATRLP
jgi:hypothetical protein